MLGPQDRRTSWTSCPKGCSRGRRRLLARSTTPRTATKPAGGQSVRPEDYGAKYPKATRSSRRKGRAAGVLRLPGRALGPHPHDQPDRVHLRHRGASAPKSPRAPAQGRAGVAMAFKLIESAQARWRAVNAPHLVALVRARARFEKGKLVERTRTNQGVDQQVSVTRRSTGLDYSSLPKPGRFSWPDVIRRVQPLLLPCRAAD